MKKSIHKQRKKEVIENMKYTKNEQIDFLKDVIFDYQRKLDNESDKSTKFMLNDIIDMYYCIKETIENK